MYGKFDKCFDMNNVAGLYKIHQLILCRVIFSYQSVCAIILIMAFRQPGCFLILKNT